MDENPIVITAACRTPIGHFNGHFRNISTTQLGSHAIKGLLNNTEIAPNTISYVDMGCVLPAGLGQAPARQAAIYADIPNTASCVTTNKMCGSGMQSIYNCFNYLQNKHHSQHVTIAGGMENMTRAPYLLQNAREGMRLGHDTIIDHMMFDGLEDAYTQHQPMGNFAELCAEKYNITRAAQDEYTIESAKRSAYATTENLFSAEITPIEIATKKITTTIKEDEGINHISIDKIPKLKPVFKKDGTITAANASNISDGAAAVMIMQQATADKYHLNAMATIKGISSYSNDPSWFTTAPIYAIQQLLTQINWDINSVDLFEINEAFSIVPLVAMQELNIPHDKININGGACVLGHPIGASGTRIVVTLLHALANQNKKRGIAAICIGGGEAIALAIELTC